MMFPTEKYKTIVADPPWAYNRSWDGGSDKSVFKGAQVSVPMPYAQMSLSDICALPVATIADDNCDLYLWTTQKYLPKAFDVINAWGFKYCQTLTWCKTPMGTGQGGLYCPTTEFIILARKGRMPIKTRVDTTWWNVKRTGKHSKKPELFQDIIEQQSDAPRIELFARRPRDGWVVWGNEV
jgi:N6-adenosine-specific RNA methylase IME4